jgi:hypothetical protein
MIAAAEERVRVERNGETLVIHIPMQLKKRGGRKEIIVPEGLPGAGEPRSAAQEPIVTALARAFHWQGLVESGRYGSITELAAALGVDRSYVRRILRLALLAPDILESIVRGEEPSGLSLERLTKDLPVSWEEQRARFGIPAGMNCVAVKGAVNPVAQHRCHRARGDFPGRTRGQRIS